MAANCTVECTFRPGSRIEIGRGAREEMPRPGVGGGVPLWLREGQALPKAGGDAGSPFGLQNFGAGDHGFTGQAVFPAATAVGENDAGKAHAAGLFRGCRGHEAIDVAAVNGGPFDPQAIEGLAFELNADVRTLCPHPAFQVRGKGRADIRSEEHTSELQSRENLVCRLLLEKKKTKKYPHYLKKKKHQTSNITTINIIE